MIEPKFNVKKQEDKPNFGIFVIEPLDQGYGHTLGVALRRVLLASLKGSAVTKVHIDGVKHIFSSLPGLKEDIVQLVLNIKKIRFALPSDKAVKARLAIRGPAKVYSVDLNVAEAEIVNKDLYLGELTSNKAKLNMELYVEPGYGYMAAEEYTGEKEFGAIVIDAMFSPVTRVNYRVESTRVGRMTDLDKLIIEISTDGTIAPFTALLEASKTLVSYFLHIYEPKAPMNDKVKVTPAVSDEVLKMTLEELDLPTRIVNALRNGGIETVGQLLSTPRKQLYKIRNLGAKSINSIEDILKQKGIALTV